MFGWLKKKKTVVEEPKTEVNEFAAIDDAIKIASEAGYDDTKAVLFVLNELIQEYEYFQRLGLKASAERAYKKIEYCRTKEPYILEMAKHKKENT